MTMPRLEFHLCTQQAGNERFSARAPQAHIVHRKVPMPLSFGKTYGPRQGSFAVLSSCPNTGSNYPSIQSGIAEASGEKKITSRRTSTSAAMNGQTWRTVWSKDVRAMLVVTNSKGAMGGVVAPI